MTFVQQVSFEVRGLGNMILTSLYYQDIRVTVIYQEISERTKKLWLGDMPQHLVLVLILLQSDSTH